MRNLQANDFEDYDCSYDALSQRSIKDNGMDLYRIERNRKQRLIMAEMMGFEMESCGNYTHFKKINRSI